MISIICAPESSQNRRVGWNWVELAQKSTRNRKLGPDVATKSVEQSILTFQNQFCSSYCEKHVCVKKLSPRRLWGWKWVGTSLPQKITRNPNIDPKFDPNTNSPQKPSKPRAPTLKNKWVATNVFQHVVLTPKLPPGVDWGGNEWNHRRKLSGA